MSFYVRVETPDGVHGYIYYETLHFFPLIEDGALEITPVLFDIENPPVVTVPIPAVDEDTLLKAIRISEIYVSDLEEQPDIGSLFPDLHCIQKIAAFYRMVSADTLLDVLVNFAKNNGYSAEEVASLYSVTMH